MENKWVEIQSKCLERANFYLDNSKTIGTGLEGSVMARELVEAAIKIEELIENKEREQYI